MKAAYTNYMRRVYSDKQMVDILNDEREIVVSRKNLNNVHDVIPVVKVLTPENVVWC